MKRSSVSYILIASSLPMVCSGLEIANYSSEKNDLFTSGLLTATPTRNGSPAFIGAAYDWSGIGYVSDTAGGRVTHFTVLSPLHVAGARHNAISLLGTNARLVTPSGEVLNFPLESYANTPALVADLDVTQLRQAIPDVKQVKPLRVLDVSGYNYNGFSLFMVGSEGYVTGSQVSTAMVRATSNILTVLDNSIYSHLTFKNWGPGDSGSPALIPYKGQLTLAGVAYGSNGSCNMLLRPHYASYHNAPVVNARMAQLGHALKWTIYDNAADAANTAPRWTGQAGDGMFTTGGNWSGGVVPNTPPNISVPLYESRPVIFDESIAEAHTTIGMGTGHAVRGMLFRNAGSGGGFVFGGPGVLTIGSAGLRNESSALLTFNAPITLMGSQNWEAAAGPLTFSGAIDNTGFLTVIGGAFDTTINGVVSGGGGLAKSDASTLTLNAVNTYAGTTFIHRGTVRLGSSGNLPATTVRFTAANEAVLDLNGRSQTLTDIRSEFGGTGKILLGGADLTVNSAATTSVGYAGEIGGAGNLIKSGSGVWGFAGQALFNGETRIQGGALRVGSAEALPNEARLRINGGVLELGFADFTRGLGTGAGQVQFAGAGGFSAYDATRVVNVGGAAATLTWGVDAFVPLGSNLMLSSDFSNATVELRNSLNLAGGTRTFVVAPGSAMIDARLAGVISNGSLVKLGNGVLELSANNSYAGQTQLNGGGLLLSAPGALGGGNLSFNGGTLILGAGDFIRPLGTGAGEVRFLGTGGFAAHGMPRTVNLGGSAQTLTWGQNGFVPAGTTLSLSSAASDSTVSIANPIDLAGSARTIQVNDSTARIDVRLLGGVTNGSLVKSGAGVLEFVSENAHGGTTQITGGALMVSSATADLTGNINLSGGGIFMPSEPVFMRSLGTGAGQVQFTGTGGFSSFDEDLVVNLGGAAASVTWGLGGFVPAGNTLHLSNPASAACVDFTNPINLAGDVRTVVAHNGTALVDARLSGVVSNGTLKKVGAGVLELVGSNTYAGGTIIAEGAVRIGSAAALPNANLQLAGVLELGAGNFTRALGAGAGQFQFTTGGFSAANGDRTVHIATSAGTSLLWGGAGSTGFISASNTLVLAWESASGTLSFENPVNLGNASQGVRVLRVENGTSAIDAKLNGVLSSSTRWGINKTGGGTLQLAAANTYSGSTTVSSGTLLVSGTLTNTSTVEVLHGAVLELSGSLNTGTIYVRPGGILRGSGTINAIVVNDGQVIVSGTGDTLILQKTLTNSGTVTVSGNAVVTVAGNIHNTGLIDLGEASPQSALGSVTGPGTVIWPVGSAAPSPLLEFTFEGTGTSAASSGTQATTVAFRNSAGVATDLRSAPGQGISGAAQDRAFDNTGATGWGHMGTGGFGVLSTNNGTQGLRSFTVQGWFKTGDSTAMTGNARILDNKSNGGIWVRTGDGMSAGTLLLGVNSAEVSAISTAWNQTEQWVFFAITYDGTASSNNVRFYKGGKTGEVTLVVTATLNAGVVVETINPFIVGNAAGAVNNNRSFKGILDNVRIYGSTTDGSGVLAIGQLEAIRIVDGAVPALVAPAGVVASPGNAPGEIVVVWDAVASAETYYVERGTSAGGAFVQIASVAALAHTDTALNPGTAYYYRVRAAKTAASSAPSATVWSLPYLPPTWDGWQYQYFATTADTGDAAHTADPDGDGIPNLMEYAFGTHPLVYVANEPAAPAVSRVNGSLTLTFVRHRSDVTYEVQASSDLHAWTTLDTNPGEVGETVTVADTDTTSPTRFLRLKISH